MPHLTEESRQAPLCEWLSCCSNCVVQVERRYCNQQIIAKWTHKTKALDRALRELGTRRSREET
eukprot:215593-Pyramimonas_sp.AAC.1